MERDGRGDLPPAPPPYLEQPEGLIRTWILSPAFRWTGGLPTEPPEEIVASEEMSEAVVDPSGILLVRRYRQRNLQGGEMGVLARVKVTSDQAQVKRLDLWFSDAAGVFLNGRLVYAGDDSYSENFPRRQGLVTLNQASLFLPLEEGENEITVLVVDAMGRCCQPGVAEARRSWESVGISQAGMGALQSLKERPRNSR